MKEFSALDYNLENVQNYIHEETDQLDLSMKLTMQLDLAVEEIFINIAHYAYDESQLHRPVWIECEINGVNSHKVELIITFIDEGIPFNPLEIDKPEISNDVSQLKIGGLGIMMTRKIMDELTYEYSDNRNKLTLIKRL